MGDALFGWSVALHGDIAIVGAYQNDGDAIFSSGSAYIFARNMNGSNNWGEVKRLNVSDASAEDRLGYSVAVFGDNAAVGAYWDDDNGTNSGSAYIFSRDEGGPNSWGEVKKLIAGDPGPWDQFGHSVAIAESSAIVGTYLESSANGGFSYVFGNYCPPGTFFTAGACALCSKFVLENETVCDDCPNDEFYVAANETCQPCPIGQVPSLSALICEQCIGDDVVSNPLTGRCSHCEGGTVPNNDKTECIAADEGDEGSESPSSSGALFGIILGGTLGGIFFLIIVTAVCLWGALCGICALLLCFCAFIVLLAALLMVSAGAMGTGGLGVGGFLGVAASSSRRIWRKGGKAGSYSTILARAQETSRFRRVKYDDLTLQEKIEEGSYSTVSLGIWSGVNVAYKQVNGASADLEEFAREATIMANVSHHPYMVELLGAVMEGEHVGLVLKYYGGGSLDEALRAGRVDANAKVRILGEVLSALLFLHSMGVVHRDIAARNVLLEEGQSARLGDFGMARTLEPGPGSSIAKCELGPIRWMAPEALESLTFSAASDAWSFGVLVWEVWSDGELPYGDTAPIAEVLNDVLKSGRRLEPAPRCPESQARVIRRLLVADPDARPRLRDILEEHYSSSAYDLGPTFFASNIDYSDIYIPANELTDVGREGS